MHPVGFIEFIKTDKDKLIRIGPRTEADEALEADRWNVGICVIVWKDAHMSA